MTHPDTPMKGKCRYRVCVICKTMLWVMTPRQHLTFWCRGTEDMPEGK